MASERIFMEFHERGIGHYRGIEPAFRGRKSSYVRLELADKKP